MDNFFDFTLEEDISLPVGILKIQSGFLKEITKGCVSLEVKEYKPSFSYFKAPEINPNLFGKMVGEMVEVKGDSLPDNKKKLHYQVNFVTEGADTFKYNIMTFSHSLDIYPLVIELNQDVQFEQDVSKYTITSSDEFCAFLRRLFGTEKIRNVIQGLYNIVRNSTSS